MKKLIHPLYWFGFLLFLGLAVTAAVQAAGSEPATTAIDILLDPDTTMIAQAQAANVRLRENYSAGFALDADHAPHISVLQRFVRSSDIEQVKAAVAKVIAKTDPVKFKLQATGYYYLPYQNLFGTAQKQLWTSTPSPHNLPAANGSAEYPNNKQ